MRFEQSNMYANWLFRARAWAYYANIQWQSYNISSKCARKIRKNCHNFSTIREQSSLRYAPEAPLQLRWLSQSEATERAIRPTDYENGKHAHAYTRENFEEKPKILHSYAGRRVNTGLSGWWRIVESGGFSPFAVA